MTHRQHLAYLAWIELQWNEPDRSDHYLMQIAAEVRRVQLSQEDQKKLLDSMYRIRFGTPEPKKPDPLPEELPPGFPKRMTKESIERANAMQRAAMVAAHKGQPGRPQPGRPQPTQRRQPPQPTQPPRGYGRKPTSS